MRELAQRLVLWWMERRSPATREVRARTRRYSEMGILLPYSSDFETALEETRLLSQTFAGECMKLTVQWEKFRWECRKALS